MGEYMPKVLIEGVGESMEFTADMSEASCIDAANEMDRMLRDGDESTRMLDMVLGAGAVARMRAHGLGDEDIAHVYMEIGARVRLVREVAVEKAVRGYSDEFEAA